MKKKFVIGTLVILIIIGLFVFFQRDNELKDISACAWRIENVNEDQYDLQLFE